MISRILTLVILIPLAILLVVFCVANRQAVPVSLDPIGNMPQLVFAAPLFLLLMGAVILGVVLGGLGTWFTQAHYRRKSWKRKYEVERLRREADESRAKLRQIEEERVRTNSGSTALVSSQAA
ncbi:DUF1049 domain-containing protein [Aurantimonas aggregata]|uniref:DUF1049 domain-containing protein n=1 Tax=Aurantimonas aggregata TaxID=2047720 RepID=A0A6L9MFP3_9HYPH|nr:LapA family protein [Aurantimonas aggregata]NDV86412.1 DUF1049 domain-containing protein [Aurantimonas aggregata]